jgi:hydroxymethylbilane synthase
MTSSANNKLRIGTRDSKLAIWQAKKVQALLAAIHIESVLVPVKSDGDLDLITPLYAMGVQGVFTKTLDAFLLSEKIDIAVHSMKDVPTQLAQGIQQAAVLSRANFLDLLLYKTDNDRDKYFTDDPETQRKLTGVIATGSVRRSAQLLHRFPKLTIENLRGNVQTRMRKLQESDWDGAVFAAAGLERIDERPRNAAELDWMLPAPAQGAIMVVCREKDIFTLERLASLNDEPTALCTKMERDFLKTLMGGCSTPISALAEIQQDRLSFKGNILSPDGKEKLEIERNVQLLDAADVGTICAQELLEKGARKIVDNIRLNLPGLS